MAALFAAQRPKLVHRPGFCLDINAHSLSLGIDPRVMIFHYFGLRWSKDSGWKFNQRVVIDSITVDGEPWKRTAR